MSHDYASRKHDDDDRDHARHPRAPGKRTLTHGLPRRGHAPERHGTEPAAKPVPARGAALDDPFALHLLGQDAGGEHADSDDAEHDGADEAEHADVDDAEQTDAEDTGSEDASAGDGAHAEPDGAFARAAPAGAYGEALELQDPRGHDGGAASRTGGQTVGLRIEIPRIPPATKSVKDFFKVVRKASPSVRRAASRLGRAIEQQSRRAARHAARALRGALAAVVRAFRKLSPAWKRVLKGLGDKLAEIFQKLPAAVKAALRTLDKLLDILGAIDLLIKLLQLALDLIGSVL